MGESLALRFATPQELRDMEEHDRPGLERRIQQGLEHVRETGHLEASDLQLPILCATPTTLVAMDGYKDGALNPKEFGVACIVVRPSDWRGPNSLGDFSLKAVCTRSLPPPPPPHLYLVEKA